MDGTKTLELKVVGEGLESTEYEENLLLSAECCSLGFVSRSRAEVEPILGVLCSSNLLRYENETRRMTITSKIAVTRPPSIIAKISFRSSWFFFSLVSASCFMGSRRVTTGT